MKTLLEFTKDINMHSDDVSIMRLLCRCELTAMKDAFCKHQNVCPINNGFEYQIQTIDFRINNCLVVAVRYYSDKNKWNLVIGEVNRNHIISEICVNDTNIENMVELITVLKHELFDEQLFIS